MWSIGKKRALCGLWFAGLLAVTPGQTPPPLDGPSVQGPRVSLQRLRGRVVVVDFWASWCAPCRQSFPVLDALSRRYEARGLSVIGVSVDDEAENCRRFVRELRPSFPVVHDASHQISDRWGPPSMPTTYVIGRDGVLVAALTGDDTRQLEAHVITALGR